MRTKVQRLQDRVEIQRLLHSYARCADTKDWEGFADLFTDDGYLVLPFGKLEKKDMVRAVASVLSPWQATQHMFSNVSIATDRDHLTTNHYLQATRARRGEHLRSRRHRWLVRQHLPPHPGVAGSSSPSVSPSCGTRVSLSSRGIRRRDPPWTRVGPACRSLVSRALHHRVAAHRIVQVAVRSAISHNGEA